MFAVRRLLQCSVCVGAWSGVAGALGAGDPWADAVVDFDAGSVPVAPFNDPSAALGSPSRMTGACFDAPGVVSLFNSPFCPSDLARVGEGGWITVRFDEPIRNDPAHLFGADVILFGNSFFIDGDFPNGLIVGGEPFATDPMRVSVSSDGFNFVDLGSFTEGQFPTQGWLDASPFQTTPGAIASDFTKPVNPALAPGDFDGLTYAQALALYDGSGGGTPIDIGPSGLSEVRFIKVSVPVVADADITVEIDAFATVPEPASAGLIVVLLSLGGVFRRGIR